MTVGCPVICSNSSSLLEVVGDAAETFNPLDMEAILAALESAVPLNVKSLIAAGWTRCRQFTWEKGAHETEALYGVCYEKALICGISGQDGAYLAQLLLEKGYEIWGTSRDASYNIC